MVQAYVTINDFKVELKGEVDEVNKMLDNLILRERKTIQNNTKKNIVGNSPVNVTHPITKKIRGGPGSLVSILEEMDESHFFDIPHNLADMTQEVNRRSKKFGRNFGSSVVSTRLIRWYKRGILSREKIGEHWAYIKVEKTPIQKPLQSSLE